MIQPLNLNNSSIQNFKGQNNSPFAAFQKPQVPAPVVVAQNEPKISGFQKFKRGIRNTIKGFNNATGVAGGVVKGLVGGTLTAVGTGVVIKNFKEADNNIVTAFKGIGKDVFKDFAWEKVIKNSPKIFTQAPIDNLKGIAKNLNFMGKDGYLKGHKGIAAVSVLAGAVVFGVNLVLGKMKANEANANLDHKLNTGHLKY